jgi:large subunit ribosomal protein L9
VKVLLIKDIVKLGKAGEIKEVKDGYGQNFLIAKGFAKKATEQVVCAWKEEQQAIIANQEAEIAHLKGVAQAVESARAVIKKKVGANGQLYGAITKEDIVQAFQEKHAISLDKKHLVLKQPIKTTGIFEIDAKLGHGIHANITVEIVTEE